jgi:hypothetical protein
MGGCRAAPTHLANHIERTLTQEADYDYLIDPFSSGVLAHPPVQFSI